ncbi:MAG: pyridoxal 5'-phosphate synthase glutaminase subunit PdxT [Armatimonadota bacterium]
MKVGVLALQGDFAKHIESLERLGVHAASVRTPEEINKLDGLIIPGGESTTVGKLMTRFGVDKAIIKRVSEGMCVFGTCTGMILLARNIEGSEQPRLGLMDITVRRNAFGRQVDSFETDLDIPAVDKEPFHAIFIRAPFAISAGSGVKVLAKVDDERLVFMHEGNCLAAAFHPELTDDTRIHRYFLDMAASVRP